MRDDPFSSDIGVVNFYPCDETHWVCYINENYFASYGRICAKKVSIFIIKRNGHCLYSEYKNKVKQLKKFFTAQVIVCITST